MVLGVDKLSLIHQFFPVFLLPHPSFHPGGNSKCLALVTICLERSSKKTCRNPKLIYSHKRTPGPSIGRENFPSTTSSPWWCVCVCVMESGAASHIQTNPNRTENEERTSDWGMNYVAASPVFSALGAHFNASLYRGRHRNGHQVYPG